MSLTAVQKHVGGARTSRPHHPPAHRPGDPDPGRRRRRALRRTSCSPSWRAVWRERIARLDDLLDAEAGPAPAPPSPAKD